MILAPDYLQDYLSHLHVSAYIKWPYHLLLTVHEDVSLTICTPMTYPSLDINSPLLRYSLTRFLRLDKR